MSHTNTSLLERSNSAPSQRSKRLSGWATGGIAQIAVLPARPVFARHFTAQNLLFKGRYSSVTECKLGGMKVVVKAYEKEKVVICLRNLPH